MTLAKAKAKVKHIYSTGVFYDCHLQLSKYFYNTGHRSSSHTVFFLLFYPPVPAAVAGFGRSTLWWWSKSYDTVLPLHLIYHFPSQLKQWLKFSILGWSGECFTI